MASVTDLRLEMDGYEPLQTMLTRNEQVDVGAVIGGIFFLFPFLWTMKYNPTHLYELRPMQQAYELKADQPTVHMDLEGNEYISGIAINNSCLEQTKRAS